MNSTTDRRGNTVLVALCVVNIFVYLATKVYYVWRNKTREKRWDTMTREVRFVTCLSDVAQADSVTQHRSSYAISRPRQTLEASVWTSGSLPKSETLREIGKKWVILPICLSLDKSAGLARRGKKKQFTRAYIPKTETIYWKDFATCSQWTTRSIQNICLLSCSC